ALDNEGSDSDSDSSEFEMFGIPEVDEYHTTHICSMPIHRLDPSMLLGFLFNTEAEWDTFVMAATDKESQRSICTGSSPLFTLLSGSSMMTPQFESIVQPIPGHITKVAAVPDASAGRMSPRVNSDSQVKSPRHLQHMPMAAPPPQLSRIRSASSPRFTVASTSRISLPDEGAKPGEEDELCPSFRKMVLANFEIGIIGAGDMGMLYARRFKQAGYVVNICDTPDRFTELEAKHGHLGLNILRDGYAVSRRSDFIIYSVPAVNIGRIVEEYGRATKVGAIVAGQTSVKTPEILAFEKHLPDDVHIVTCHSMHGPNIDTKGQPLAIIRHRSDDRHYAMAVEALGALESRVIYLTYEEHDRITADTQAATHLSFISLGTAWSLQGYYPWLNPQFISGINNVKVAMALRIYASKWHVYAGLAIMNPLAKKQLQCYVESMTTLYKLMVAGKRQEFRDLVHEAADFV
ncbi:prephenate dehydrogenase (NADP(+)), partial [Coemansia sp. S85]